MNSNILIQSKSNRIGSVEALRGVAALAVTWFHLTNGHSSWIRETGSLGWLGVEVFFVVSGFVIPMSLSRGSAQYQISKFPKFMARRLVRLEPPYLISIAVVLLLWELSSRFPGFAGGEPGWSILQVSLHFLYLIPLTGEEWLQPVYWTLAYEFVFYIFVGLLFSAVSSNRTAFLCFISCLLLLGFLVLPVLFMLFVMGIAVFRNCECGDRVSLAIGIIVVSALLMWLRGAEFQAMTGMVTSVLILATTKLDFNGVIARPLLWLGSISYSLYLLHLPIGGRVVNLGRRFVPETAAGEVIISLLALVVSIIAAWIFHRAIEIPAIRASRRI